MNGAFHHTGFTLIEVLIVSFLTVALVVVLFSSYQSFTVLSAVQEAHTEVGGSARTIVAEFSKAALQADRIMPSHIFAGVLYTSGSTTAVFELPSIDSSGNIIANAYDYTAFYASSTYAYMVTDPGAGSVRASTTRTLSDALNALAFTYNNPTVSSATSTDIDVTTQIVARGQTLQSHLHQTVRLRNL